MRYGYHSNHIRKKKTLIQDVLVGSPCHHSLSKSQRMAGKLVTKWINGVVLAAQRDLS